MIVFLFSLALFCTHVAFVLHSCRWLFALMAAIVPRHRLPTVFGFAFHVFAGLTFSAVHVVYM